MSYPLAVFVHEIGSVSETFIRRHVQDLLPGGTVVVATEYERRNADWKAGCPVLVVNGIRQPLGHRIIHGDSVVEGSTVPDFVAGAVKRFLRKHKVQVILGEYLDQSVRWLDLARELNVRFFAHAHGVDVSGRLRASQWRSEYLRYGEGDGVITMSHASHARLISLGLSESKVHAIPYGVDVPPEHVKRVPGDIVRCLAVGRMVAKKAPILLLDAFRRAFEACPQLRLDYVGAGPLLAAARDFVHAFDLGGRVILHGQQSHEVVRRLMGEADMFVQHSATDIETGDEEGLPVAILEAMSQGLPVVSTRHSGIPEAVSDGITGYLVNEGDAVAMADRIVAIARDNELLQRMSLAGWERASELFTWEREREQLLKLMALS